MTERLYYTDATLVRFTARVVDTSPDGLRVYLDRTAFYPDSGGQPSDHGTLNGVRVVDVVDEEERVAHVVASPLNAVEVEGQVDWARRRDHMAQHSGQHLLSAVFEELHGMKTVSFHLGVDACTIDLETPAVTAAQAVSVERRANELVMACHPFHVAFEDAAEAQGLRKASERTGTLRIVSIEGVDRSACGGTHVATTGEIGPVLIRKIEKIRTNTRVEFLCGARAIAAARADYDTLTAAARLFSSPATEVPALIAALQTQAKDADKARRKLAVELATRKGAELYAATAPDANGTRTHIERIAKGALDDETRALAQGFTAASKAVFIAACDEPASVMLAVSNDAGVHAGNRMKELLAAHGGRGGGAAQMAQASLPDKAALDALLAAI